MSEGEVFSVNSKDRWFRNYSFGSMLTVGEVPNNRGFTKEEFEEIMGRVLYPHVTKISAMYLLYKLSKTASRVQRGEVNRVIAELFNSINCEMFEN